MAIPPRDPPDRRSWLKRRGFSLTLLIAEFGVLSSLVFSLALFVFGAARTFRVLWEALPDIGGEATSKTLLLSAVEQTDVLLVATALLIISVGLQALFVQQLDNLPPWLHIRTFDDLKQKLLGIVVVALSVEFFKVALKWDGTASVLPLGLSLAAVILAIAVYSVVLQRSGGEGHEAGGPGGPHP
ncbi:YqhA family protein [Deinococcus sonorensis]|uniref:YqhA family protein n=2 Tax=Deinococcus sonorensis TaxID=309891 RepID=A0AAU7UDU4_9DEIO